MTSKAPFSCVRALLFGALALTLIGCGAPPQSAAPAPSEQTTEAAPPPPAAEPGPPPATDTTAGPPPGANEEAQPPDTDQHATEMREEGEKQVQQEKAAPPTRGLARAAPQRDAFQLPEFPWPPPTPSARATLSRARFAGDTNLLAVGARLTRALNDAGYSEYSFYHCPGGFALVARLERMRADGTPEPEQFRFLQPGAEQPFDLRTYVQQLFFAPEGSYRQISFIVSDKPFRVDETDVLTSAEATALLRRGANRLPDSYSRRPFTQAYQVTALIYEFRKGPRDRDVVTLDPGRLPGRTHLEKSGILAALDHTR